MGRKVVSGNSGKMGRLFIGGQEFCAEDWDIQETATEEDTTSTCDAGYKVQEFGNKQLDGNFNYTFDLAANAWETPRDLSVGQKWALTKLYLHATSGVALQDGPFFLFTLQVVSHQQGVPVDGKVTGTVTFKSSGSYTLPTGSDSSGA